MQDQHREEPVMEPMHLLPSADTAVPLAESQRIAYTRTRVMPEVWLRLARTEGIVPNDRSPLSETYKMLRNQVLMRLRADGHKVLAVSSPRGGFRGKSLTAMNLALTIAADYDSAVLLVDADLATRGVQQLCGLAHEAGLGDHLRLGLPLGDLLLNPGVDRLVVLPAGQQSALDSAELLGTRAAQQMIQAMKERYADRYIVVDLPPLLDTADAMAFLPHVDTTLLVLEQHVTRMADLDACAELLAPFPLMGSVMCPRSEPVARRAGR